MPVGRFDGLHRDPPAHTCVDTSGYHVGMFIRTYSAVAVTIALIGAAAPSVSAARHHSHNYHSAQMYIHSYYQHITQERSALASSRRDAAAFTDEVKRACPGVLRDAPEGSGLLAFAREISGTSFAAVIATFAHYEGAYASELAHIRWSGHKLGELMAQEARNERAAASFKAPRLCFEARAWHANHFLEVPTATTMFNDHFARLLVMPAPLRQINSLVVGYLGSANKRLLKRTYALNIGLNKAVTRDWITTTLTIMRALGIKGSSAHEVPIQRSDTYVSPHLPRQK